MTHESVRTSTEANIMAAEITWLCVCVWWQVCLAVFDLCFIRGLRKMLLSWKTCHGANMLCREDVCVCICLSSQTALLWWVCICDWVSVRDRICVIIRPVPCQHLFTYIREPDYIRRKHAFFCRDTVQHTHTQRPGISATLCVCV